MAQDPSNGPSAQRPAGAARAGARLFPDEQLAFRQREKNLLAAEYLRQTDLESATSFSQTLRDRAEQEAMHRPGAPGTAGHAARLDELERRYREHHRLEDFRELMRALREAPQPRREAALPTLQDGLDRFGDREVRWFIAEVQLGRRWEEVRLLRRALDESPGDARLRAEHRTLRSAVLAEHIEHLYEVAGSLPPSPERHRRELELAGRLLEAGRFAEAVKQAQAARRGPEVRVEAWVIMARAFVGLGFAPEASECFRAMLAELDATPGVSAARVLAARYAYAEFLLDEAARRSDPELARQARRVCSDILIEDIDYRDVRGLCARADRILDAAQR